MSAPTPHDTPPNPASPLRAHLLRATHAWCCEQGYTPYLQVLVDALVQVPMDYVRDGSITLNISYDSTNKLHMGDEYITFQARFNGVAREVLVPLSRVLALFARETGEGYQAMSPQEFLDITQGRSSATEPAPTNTTSEARPAAAPSPAVTLASSRSAASEPTPAPAKAARPGIVRVK